MEDLIFVIIVGCFKFVLDEVRVVLVIIEFYNEVIDVFEFELFVGFVFSFEFF